MILLLLLIARIFANDIPEQVHVAVGAYPGLIQFTWSTRLSTPTSAVRIGLNPSYLKYYYGTSNTFTNGTNSWVIHTANATLYPGATYMYQVGCILTNFSQVFKLTVPPSTGSSSTYLIYADLDIGLDGNLSWTEIGNRWPQLNIDAVIHMGDIAYDLSTDYGTWGDAFMNSIQPVASSVPYMVCVGNHEGDDNYVNYLARFAMPNNQFYYTWASGYVRFLAIDTETIVQQASDLTEMIGYIQNVLNRTQADKEAYPWLVVYGHRPFYCLSTQKKKSCGSESRLLQSTLESLFYTYNVDLYVNGHVHNYERTTPVYQEKVMGSGGSGNVYIDPLATIYVTTGGIGADGNNYDIDTQGVPSWLAAQDGNLSYSVFTAFNATHLFWQQWETGKNKTSDEFWIIKGSSAFAEQ
ncbi:unnamed protein product [Blepharisma stoltei]|uniref:Purple acid phosphatase n=1 Tax=Blepharisma stoltei TaxID=1481888 RepID=A0AAU9IGB5_9CILI|nr:unnamed protein product [Blepharisma stoltei]